MKGLAGTALVFMLLCCPAAAAAQEGEGWWWACKRADFVVAGELTYDSSKYYEVSSSGLDSKNQKYYWLVGTISISKVLYINRNSRYLEDYQQYLKHENQKYPVLISAMKSDLESGDWWEKSNKAVFHPLLYDIPKGPSIFALSQVFLFPIHDLKLEDGVPTENVEKAMKLIGARSDNLLSLSKENERKLR